MTELLKWTLDTIRADSELVWLEERRFEWVPIVHTFVDKLLNGAVIIILTDKDREWFDRYAIGKINRPFESRPYLPFFSAKGTLPNISIDSKPEVFNLYTNMLDVVCNNYLFWYVGRYDNKIADFAKKQDDNFLWIFDEPRQNSFMLRSVDENLDSKLISLLKLLDKTIDAVMFGEVGL